MSVIKTADLQIFETIATISTSWSPSCRSGKSTKEEIVSRRTWPEMTTIGIESV